MRSLQARYRHLGVPIEAPGEWPVLIEPWAPTRPGGITRLHDAPPVLDRQLREAGDKHLDMLRISGANLFDGPVLALDSAVPGCITVRPGGYFDHVRSGEPLAREWEAGAGTPLRDRLDHRAAGDPLHNGSGRCASLSVGALMVWEGESGPEFVLGRRCEGLAAEPGKFHVVPAGMIEPGACPFLGALERELAEEVALGAGQAQRALAGASVLGLSFNLLALRVELSCLLIVTGPRPMLDAEEHADARWWPFTDAGMLAALSALGPERMVGFAAGALELARWRVQSR